MGDEQKENSIMYYSFLQGKLLTLKYFLHQCFYFYHRLIIKIKN